MSEYRGLELPFRPDYPALIDNILRKGTPKRVFNAELFQDQEITEAIAQRFDLMPAVRKDDPDYVNKRRIAVLRFCGFDYVWADLVDVPFPLNRSVTEDSADLKKAAGRYFMEEHRGPITTWEEFEKYPWPDPTKPSATAELEWYSRNLPDDMCIVSHTGHFAEYLAWMMGYETLCYALFDQRDLVKAIFERVLQYHVAEVKVQLQFERVKIIWGSDDMGFKTGTLISPADMREFVLPGHKVLAKMAHDAGRPYLLHSCGKLTEIIDDLIDDVKLDGKHSYEDTIEDVRQVKHTYGRRIAVLGGIDMDFLCRSDEQAIRQRVRETLDVCQSGGGYCLGTGNTVANYIPLDNYLTMLDEGRLYSRGG